MFASDKSGKPAKADTVSLDSDGRYEFKGLPRGELDIIVRGEGYSPRQKHVNISSEKTDGVDFTLSKGRKLAIEVTDQHGRPVEGAMAMLDFKQHSRTYLMDILSREYPEMTGAGISNLKGIIEFRDLASQKYTINISKDGYRGKRITVRVGNEAATAKAVLEKE